MSFDLEQTHLYTPVFSIEKNKNKKLERKILILMTFVIMITVKLNSFRICFVARDRWMLTVRGCRFIYLNFSLAHEHHSQFQLTEVNFW